MRLSNLIQMMYITMLWMKRWLPGSHFRSRTGRKGTIIMTENEAIKGLMFLKEKLYNGIFQDRLNCIDLAISALEEIQKYRQIGTVEECREAVEKQKLKKPTDYDEDLGYFKCPSCGCSIMADEFSDHKYCLNCGQKLEWEESEEE